MLDQFSMPEEVWITNRTIIRATKVIHEEASLSCKIFLLHLKKIAGAYIDDEKESFDVLIDYKRLPRKMMREKNFADAILIIFLRMSPKIRSHSIL